MATLPLNANGKIDRGALPVPDISSAKPDRKCQTPRDELEHQLVSLFEKVLGVRPVSIEDDFFALGGHSLSAIRLFAHIEQMYGKKLPLSALFLAPTVQQLAAIIRQENWKSPHQALVPIQPRGTKPILFSVHGAGGEVLFYRDLTRHLGDDQPFYGIRARPYHKRTEQDENLVELAREYLREVRSLQPEGPYYLAGTSLGGVCAFEMGAATARPGSDGGIPGIFRFVSPGISALSSACHSAASRLL